MKAPASTARAKVVAASSPAFATPTCSAFFAISGGGSASKFTLRGSLPRPLAASAAARTCLRLGRSLLVEHRDRLAVDPVGVLGRVADRGHADPATLCQGGHHVEDDAGLPGVVEVEAASRGDVEQVVGGQVLVGRVGD